MSRLLVLLFVLACADAQIVIQKVAGADRHSGEAAWDLGLHAPGTAWDTAGNAYFATFNRVWKQHPDGIVEIVAGTGESGYSGDGGPAVQAKLADPGDVQRDAAGNLYFFDYSNHRIRRVDAGGLISTVAGNGIEWQSGMDVEGGVEKIPILSGRYTVDTKGIVYLADLRWMVRRFDTGNVSVYAGNGPFCEYPVCAGPDYTPSAGNSIFKEIVDVAVNPVSGELYILEAAATAGFIHRVASDHTVTRVKELPSAPFRDLALDNNGGIYVASQVPEQSAGTLIEEPTGAIRSIPNSLFIEFPLVLFNDAKGRVVYLDGMNVRSAEDGSVLMTFPDGQPRSSSDGTGAGDARLVDIGAIAVNHRGEVYFTEPSTCRVRKFDRDGILRTVLGSGACGDGLPALPNPLEGIAFGPDDRLWVRANQRTFVSRSASLEKFSEMMLPELMRDGTTIALDSRGRLHTNGNNQIARLEVDGRVAVVAVGTTSLGTDSKGTVYIAVPAFSPMGTSGVFRVEDSGYLSRVFVMDPDLTQFVIDTAGHLWNGLAVLDGEDWRNFGDSSSFVTAAATFAIAPSGDIYVRKDTAILRVTGIGQRQKPTFTAADVVNGASYVRGAIAEGELITIVGSNFGVDRLQSFRTVNNHVPAELGPVRVIFYVNPGYGIAGAIAAVTPTRINVFVPYCCGSSDLTMRVQVDDAMSDPVVVPMNKTSFGLGALDARGKDHGAILNQNGTVNSRANRAPKGSIIVLFGTGEGQLAPQAENGAINVTTPYPKARGPLAVRIGGQSAEIVFQGGAPALPQGVYEIKARIPASTSSGDVPVEVVAEDGSKSNQVTVAVQ